MEAGAGIRSPDRPRPRAKLIAAVLLSAAVAGLGIGVGLHLMLAGHAPTPEAIASGQTASAAGQATGVGGLRGQATWAVGAIPAPAITALHDQTGARFTLSSLHGRTVAMTFFDSYCTQACPLEGRALAVAESALPAAQRPVLVVVSVNPRDTPASTRAAAANWGLAQAGAWYWLRGSHAQLARVWKAYHIFVAPPRAGDISHTEALYLIGRRGDERSAFLYPFAPRFVSMDLRTLASQRKG